MADPPCDRVIINGSLRGHRDNAVTGAWKKEAEIYPA